MIKKKVGKWYVVYRGRDIGVFDNWSDCKNATDGYDGARFKAFKTYEEARGSFLKRCVCKARRGQESDKAWVDKLFPQLSTNSPFSDAWRTCESGPSLPFYCTDAACTNPAGGIVEYRCIHARSKTDAITNVFSYGPFACGSNNIGEYVALVQALIWLETHDCLSTTPIYTDSRVAIAWVSNPSEPGSRTTLKRISDDLVAELRLCDDWIKTPAGRAAVLKRVKHWDTFMWGEIPADYGRK